MEEGLKLSNAFYRYALGGFVKLRGGALKLYEDRVELSRLFGSITIPLSELENDKKSGSFDFKQSASAFFMFFFIRILLRAL